MKDGLTQVKELKDKIHEQYIEIQELNKRVEDLKTINEDHQILNGMLRKENDRLNNIINELEKWLDKKEKLTFNSWNKGIHEVQRKLQELKGSESNE